LHQPLGLGIVNRLLINATDQHPVGDTGLLEQPTAGR
jgi:hypothetical protein